MAAHRRHQHQRHQQQDKQQEEEQQEEEQQEQQQEEELERAMAGSRLPRLAPLLLLACSCCRRGVVAVNRRWLVSWRRCLRAAGDHRGPCNP
jgi:hypothetical protein